MRSRHNPLQKPNIRRFHLALQRMAVDTDSLYAELGLDPQLMDTDGASISLLKHCQMMERAAEISNNRFLGLTLGLDSRNSELGVLSYMLSNASNIEAALDLLQRYVALVAPGSAISLLEEEDTCVVTFKIKDIPPSLCPQSVEMTLAQYVLMFRTVLNDNAWQPTRIYFEHSAPDEDDLQSFPLKGELIFGHYFSGVGFPKELKEYANNDFDPQLLALLESQVLQSTETLLNSDSLLDRIRLLISSNLGNVEVTADTVATELGMSRRTLHRRLSESGTAFNVLREDIVINVAKKSLSKTSVSITELAEKLGYSDTSAFDRAFKRLVGETPLKYRKKHRQV
jgi:AraC-like DNA-binding protein